MKNKNERVSYGLTRSLLKERDEQGEGHPPENLGVVAGSIASDGFEQVAISLVALGETLILPITGAIDIYHMVRARKVKL